jgi:hypothetical protein
LDAGCGWWGSGNTTTEILTEGQNDDEGLGLGGEAARSRGEEARCRGGRWLTGERERGRLGIDGCRGLPWAGYSS